MQKNGGNEQEKGRDDEPFEEVVGGFAGREVFFVAIELGGGLAGKGGEIGAGVHGKEVTACGLCKFAESGDVEFADDVFAVGILPEPVLSFCVGDGTSGGGADADCDDEQVLAAGLAGDFGGGVHGVFTIAEDD